MAGQCSQGGDGSFRGADGKYIDIVTYVDRIFDEKDKLSNSQRETLQAALIEARTTTATAMVEAKDTVKASLIEAKIAADAVQLANTKRLDNLESGGAPFASRLDQSLTILKADVDVLKENMVKTTVLDALREQTVKETQAQKRQIRNLAYSTAAAGLVAGLSVLFQVLSGSPVK